VVLELKGYSGYRYGMGEESPLARKTIPLTGNTFEGELKLPVLRPGYYYLVLKQGDTELLSRGLSVETYQKPAYQLEIEKEKRAIFAGEETNFQVKASFFEGTPVPGVSLNYYINGQQGTVKTDNQGRGTISYTGKVDPEMYRQYAYAYLGVDAQLPEAGEISATSVLYVFKSKVHLGGEVIREGDTFNLDLKLSQVELDKINTGEYLLEENYVRDPVPGSPVKVSLYQDVWEKIESGERYDFINKRVEKAYYYRHSTRHIRDYDLTTDGAGKASLKGTVEEGESYYLEVTAKDGEGREVIQRYHIPGSNYYYEYSYYHLKPESAMNSPGETTRA
jgi:uncharacterized protein YfaS (alpha-2-macroglobulin family)